MGNVLIIIPARGGSKGIPRKNLRSLNGKPLIFYTINTALKSKFKPAVYVSSDDVEILSISGKIGAKLILRDSYLSCDKTTLDSVVCDACSNIEKLENKLFDVIVTLQPTSPLLSVESLDNAIDYFIQNLHIDTLISSIEDTHLTWSSINGNFQPLYQQRVNRQYLPKVHKETGALLICRPNILESQSRIGKIVDLFPLPQKESIDIDSVEDWAMCEFYLGRKSILFVLTGNSESGMGHVYNCLQIANEIVTHDIRFLVDRKSNLAYNKISSLNYSVMMQSSENILQDVLDLNPNVVINDILDTDLKYVQGLKERGCLVINFEDIGPGSMCADVLFNPIYSKRVYPKNHYYGHKYFMLRDEFILNTISDFKSGIDPVKNVLIAFGGVDPNNYTLRVLRIIEETCVSFGIKITVVLGMGYQEKDTLSNFTNVLFFQNVGNMVDYIREADLVFTSAGRTTYEIASQGIPTIVLAQNERELTHLFACQENGFIEMGLGFKQADESILKVFLELVEKQELRVSLIERMRRLDLIQGKKRVMKIINNLLN